MSCLKEILVPKRGGGRFSLADLQDSVIVALQESKITSSGCVDEDSQPSR